jgi:hypothetical protein
MKFARPSNAGANESEPRGDVEIRRAEWLSFLDGFSRQHLHWMATIEETSAGEVATFVEERPFEGMSIDHAGARGRVYIQMGTTGSEEMTHVIQDPRRIRFQQSRSGEHRGVEILSADGRTTVLRFRSQARPELLDGM